MQAPLILESRLKARWIDTVKELLRAGLWWPPVVAKGLLVAETFYLSVTERLDCTSSGTATGARKEKHPRLVGRVFSLKGWNHLRLEARPRVELG